jgi:hypothetical protein
MPLEAIRAGSTINETISTKKMDMPRRTPMLKRPRCSATASVANAATVLSWGDEHGDWSGGAQHAACVGPWALVLDLAGACDDMDAAGHAQADQQWDHDDIGEVEGQVQRGRASHGPQGGNGQRRQNQQDIREAAAHEDYDQPDGNNRVENGFRNERRIAVPAPVTLAGAPAASGATAWTALVNSAIWAAVPILLSPPPRCNVGVKIFRGVMW